MPVSGYFDTPFAIDGSLQSVPDGVQSNGSVSYNQGYGILYSTPVASGGLNIGRAQMNQLFNDITTALQQYQQNGIPAFITTAMNGGTPYSYNQYAMVLFGGVAYQSNTNSNTDTPPSSKWNVANIGASNLYVGGTSSGAANAQVLASLSPSGFALTNGYGILFQSGFTNTTATTLAITSPSISATAIQKNTASGLAALTGGEIVVGNEVWLVYNAANTCWVLMNPVRVPNVYQASSLNATGTTSTTPLMMGLGASFTPRSSGIIEITINGNCANNAGDGVGVVAQYGTGSAPTNGAALTGTQVGGQQNNTGTPSNGFNAFTCTGIITSPLTLGTTYWVDAAVKTISAGGTATISTVNISIKEL